MVYISGAHMLFWQSLKIEAKTNKWCGKPGKRTTANWQTCKPGQLARWQQIKMQQQML